jgi:superfamily II DNA or RNA helicase
MTHNRIAQVVHVYIESKLRIRLSELGEAAAHTLLTKTTYRDPLYAQRRRQGITTFGMSPRIRTSTAQDGMLVLWRGALGKTLRYLKQLGRPYQLHDNRLWLPSIPLGNTIELRPYQQDPVAVMTRRQQTVGRGPAGCGKTEMLLAAAAHFGQPTLVLVWQERQQQVWRERVPKWFGFEVGGIGGAFKHPKLDSPIVVGMVQSVRNRIEELKWRFGCVICDEVSRFAAPTLREVVNNLPAAVRLGASDDERRRDGREFLLYDTFGPKGWHLGKTTGQCDVEIVAVPTPIRYEDPQDIPEDWTSLIDGLVNNARRNRLVLGIAQREAAGGHRVLIWSDRVEHCRWLKYELLKRGVTAGLLIGGKDNKAEADRTEAGLRSGRISVGIGTAVAEQSINIRPLDRGIMTCASADRKLLRFRQMRGRLARPFEGKHSRLFYLWDRRVPVLRRRVYNIKRRYRVKVVRQAEEASMAEKAAVTLETLKVGCKVLGLKAPRDADAKKLETLIKRELTKNKTYGSYCCGACFRDIIDRLPVCPFCAAKFKPVPDETPDELEDAPDDAEEAAEEEPAEDEYEEQPAEDEGEEADEEEGEPEETEDEPEEEEGEEEPEEEGEEPEEEGEEEPEEEGEEPEEEGEEPEEEGEEEEVIEDEEPEEETEEGEEEEADEDEEPQPRTKPKKGGAVEKLKEAERKEKREQIRSELPYSLKQLKAMKRTALVMIAGVLGHTDPVRIGSAEGLIKFILKAQTKHEAPEPKPVVKKIKPAAKPVAKPAAKPAAKPVVKPKTKK